MSEKPHDDEQPAERDNTDTGEPDSEPTSSGHSTADTQTERNTEDESPS